MNHGAQLMDDVSHSSYDVWAGSWRDNPYRTMLSNSEDATLFITDPGALSQYKKYLRYFIARWGYSTHIAKFELCNETSQTCHLIAGSTNVYDPYGQIFDQNLYNTYIPNFNFNPQYPINNWVNQTTQNTFSGDLYNWHHNIAQYLRDILGIKQLINTSYALGPNILPQPPDYTYGDSYISTVAEHNGMTAFNTNLIRSITVKKYWNTYHKPFMFEEQYFDPALDNSPSGFYGPTFQNDLEMHNDIWSTTFMGTMGVTPVIYPGASTRYETQQTSAFVANNLPALSAFLSGVDFRSLNYVPQTQPAVQDGDTDPYLMQTYPISSNPLESFFLNGSTRAIGWVRMRESYWGTATPYPIRDCYYTYNNANQTYHNLDPLQGSSDPVGVSNQTLTLSNFTNGNYTVDWYDTRIPNDIFESDPVQASGGNLILNIPALAFDPYTCRGCRTDIAFKVYSGLSFQRQAQIDTTLHFGIMPNPSNGAFTLVMKKNTGNPSVEVFDVLGKSVFKKQFADLQNGQIDISGLSSGIYYVRITNDEGFNETHKVVKE